MLKAMRLLLVLADDNAKDKKQLSTSSGQRRPLQKMLLLTSVRGYRIGGPTILQSVGQTLSADLVFPATKKLRWRTTIEAALRLT
jgi:hypothetical protein